MKTIDVCIVGSGLSAAAWLRRVSRMRARTWATLEGVGPDLGSPARRGDVQVALGRSAPLGGDRAKLSATSSALWAAGRCRVSHTRRSRERFHVVSRRMLGGRTNHYGRVVCASALTVPGPSAATARASTGRPRTTTCAGLRQGSRTSSALRYREGLQNHSRRSLPSGAPPRRTSARQEGLGRARDPLHPLVAGDSDQAVNGRPACHYAPSAGAAARRDANSASPGGSPQACARRPETVKLLTGAMARGLSQTRAARRVSGRARPDSREKHGPREGRGAGRRCCETAGSC